MKKRTLRKLNKMHIYAHRRFHDSEPGKCPHCGVSHWLWWLGVRTEIQHQLAKMRRLQNGGER